MPLGSTENILDRLRTQETTTLFDKGPSKRRTQQPKSKATAPKTTPPRPPRSSSHGRSPHDGSRDASVLAVPHATRDAPSRHPTVRVVVRMAPTLDRTTSPSIVALPSGNGGGGAGISTGSTTLRTAYMAPPVVVPVVQEDRNVSSTLESMDDATSTVSSTSRSTVHSGRSFWRRRRPAAASTRTGVNGTIAAPTVPHDPSRAATDAGSVSSRLSRWRPHIGRGTSSRHAHAVVHSGARCPTDQGEAPPLLPVAPAPTTRHCIHEWDAVYGPTVSSRHFYDDLTRSFDTPQHPTTTWACSPLWTSLQKGHDTTLMFYGGNGRYISESMLDSGTPTKATIHAPPRAPRDDILSHVLNDLFPFQDVASENFDPCAMAESSSRRNGFVVQVSVVELLPTRKVRDLLATSKTTSDEDDTISLLSGNRDLDATPHTVRRAHYRGTITRKTLHSLDQARNVVRQSTDRLGRARMSPRIGGSSAAQSESHVIYTFTVTSTTTFQSPTTAPQATPLTTSSATLTLVDLAGVSSSLTPSSNHATQHDMVVLGQVLTALLHQKSFVPFYNDSALTKVLRDALGVSCRVVLVACVSPAASCSDDTLATLQYAEHIRSIPPVAAVLATPPKTKKTILFDPHGMLTTPSQRATALQAENMILQARIANLTRRQKDGTDDGSHSGAVVTDSSQFSNVPTRLKSGSDSLEVASLEAKVMRARQQRQVTRDRCQTVTATTERLRSRCQSMSKQVKPQSTEKSRTDGKNGVSDKVCTLVLAKVELCNELVTLVNSIEPNHNKSALSMVQVQIERLAKSLRDNEDRLQHILANEGSRSEPPSSDGDVHRHELQDRIEALTNNIDAATHENDTLRLQNKQLVSEIQRLRLNKPKSSSEPNLGGTIDFLGDELDSFSGVHDENSRLTPEHRNIRSHAALLLDWADRAIQKARDTPTHGFECGSSTVASSSLGTDLRPSSFTHRTAKNTIDHEVVFGNMVPTTGVYTCPCQDSVLTSNPPHVEFYLPKLGIMCCCGRKQEVYLNDPDPSHLVNILRDWQTDFLSSLGVRTAADLVHAYSSNKQAPKRLAQSMRLWRMQHGLLSVKTKSCGIALRIWSRTCHAVLSALQDTGSATGRPDFLDVSFSSATVSSLGFGNSVSDVNLSRDDDFGPF